LVAKNIFTLFKACCKQFKELKIMRVNLQTQGFYANKNIALVQRTNVQKVNFGNNTELSPAQKLAQTRAYYQHALEKGYAIPAFNVNDLLNVHGIINAVKRTQSPLIIQASKGARDYAGLPYLVQMVKVAKEEAKGIPVMLHLDHGDTFQVCKECIDGGFDSVMIDGSKFPLDENIRLTKEVVDYAHSKGIFVEAELGKLAGVEDEVSNKTSKFTDPQEAARFVKETGCDSLAISIGTSHGAVKFRPDEKPQLDFERLSEIKKAVEAILPENIGKKPGDAGWRQYPFVLHGASSAPKDLIDMFNQSVVIPRKKFETLENSINDLVNSRAGALTVLSAIEAMKSNTANYFGKGVPEEMYKEATLRGISKVNVDTDFRLGYVGTFKNVAGELDVTDKASIDPRTYGKPIMKTLETIGARKTDMLNSSGQAMDATDKATKAVKLAKNLDIKA